ncbi:MAG: peptidylprolyl isomerase [Gemmatimonadales bacterium]
MTGLIAGVVRSARFLVLGTALAGAACSGAPSIEDARKAVIVDAEGSQLTGAMLEEYLLRIPEPTSRVAADMVVSAWIDVALLQHAERTDVDLFDSVLVDRALRPDAVRGLLQQFAMERLQARPEPSDAEADSIFSTGNARVFQQILLPMNVRDTSLANRERAQLAKSLRDRANTGESYLALVREYSNDSVYKNADGYMPAAEFGDLPRSIANAIWNLAPNEISQLVPSPRGLHILRRATVAESRPGLKAWLQPRLAEAENVAYTDSMRWAHDLKVPAGAVERMRVFAVDPMQKSGGDEPLVTWREGQLDPATIRLWLSVFAPRDRVQFAGAADTTISNWLLQVGKWEVIVQALAPAGVPTPDARGALVPQYRESLQRIIGAWKLVGQGRAATAATAAVVDTLTSGKVPYRPPPGALSGILRGMFKVDVRPDPIDVIVESALLERARREAADTSSRQSPTADSTVEQ